MADADGPSTPPWLAGSLTHDAVTLFGGPFDGHQREILKDQNWYASTTFALDGDMRIVHQYSRSPGELVFTYDGPLELPGAIRGFLGR